MTTRTNKVSSLIKREIGAFISREAFEGIQGLLTITEVETSPDLEQAKVFFSVISQPAEEVLKILKSRLYEIQGALNKKLMMRKVPRIEFVIDKSGEYAAKINKLIDQLDEQ